MKKKKTESNDNWAGCTVEEKDNELNIRCKKGSAIEESEKE